MNRVICKNYEEMSLLAAYIVASRIKDWPCCVLGLATGSSPEGLYSRLAEMHKSEGLDFSEVVSYNLDEYYPIKKDDAQSYARFMWDKLFSHINIKPENVHLPNGESADPHKECAQFEQLLSEAGGVDLQVLGIGANGHIGFNEPDRELAARTHLTDLTASTIESNKRFFSSADEVPKKALTMGIGTIMEAGEILLLITGSGKSEAAKKLFSGVITTDVPVTLLNLHQNVTVLVDASCVELD